jgi:hypothetical protein
MKLLGSALGGAAKTGIAANATGSALGSAAASLLSSSAFVIGSGIAAGILTLMKMDTSEDDSVTDENGAPTALTQDLVNRGVLDTETYQPVAPQGFALNGMPLSAEQKAAAEDFFDVWKEFATSDEISDDLEGRFDTAWANLEEAFAGQDDLFNALNNRLDSLQLSDPEGWTNMEDLPAGWFADISGALNRLTQSDEYKGDAQRSLPGLIEAACERGTAKKPVQVTVTLDGNVVMDYVDRGLADSYHFRG